MAKKGWSRPPMTKERLRNQFRSLIGNPFNVIVFITLLLLFTLIIIPLLAMVQNTFVVAKSELRNIPGAKIGDYTLYYWKYLLASPLTKTIFWEPLIHSLLIGALTTVISVPVGALIAWLMVRSDIPGKR
ncbi:MAG: iron ABC transporter permease, partial [Lachnospiraceae bacterium]|nr:iron ABC transporter permease [Lachnospiraceae bacterium]